MRSGLTLVEILVALVLLAIGALAIVGASAGAIRAARQGREAAAALSMARVQVEQQRSRPCDSAGPRILAAPVTAGRHRGATLFALPSC